MFMDELEREAAWVQANGAANEIVVDNGYEVEVSLVDAEEES